MMNSIHKTNPNMVNHLYQCQEMNQLSSPILDLTILQVQLVLYNNEINILVKREMKVKD